MGTPLSVAAMLADAAGPARVRAIVADRAVWALWDGATLWEHPNGSDEPPIAELVERHSAGRLKSLDIQDVDRLAAPVTRPGKIVCIGLNYKNHAEETGAVLPEEPVVFLKDAGCLCDPDARVPIPRGSEKTDWEVELGVVIGSCAQYLESPAVALEYVEGFVVSHDVSERAFQLERGGQWTKGKSCENFNPVGPALVSTQAVNHADLNLNLSVNGDLKQEGNTSDMAFGVPYIVWYLSQFMVLRPGDLITTGTPAGVAMGSADSQYLRAGDYVELAISGLGRCGQYFVSAE